MQEPLVLFILCILCIDVNNEPFAKFGVGHEMGAECSCKITPSKGICTWLAMGFPGTTTLPDNKSRFLANFANASNEKISVPRLGGPAPPPTASAFALGFCDSPSWERGRPARILSLPTRPPPPVPGRPETLLVLLVAQVIPVIQQRPLLAMVPFPVDRSGGDRRSCARPCVRAGRPRSQEVVIPYPPPPRLASPMDRC